MWRACKQLRVKDSHHCNAGTAGPYHCLGTFKNIEGSNRHASRFVPVSRVKTWLAATGLRGSKFNRMTKSLENTRNCKTDSRSHLVDKAGNKKIDVHGMNCMVGDLE